MLFSDIEGSTALLSRLGDRYGAALSAQRRVMRAAIASWSGREMGTEGDSFFVVFESAHHAMSACLQAQRELAGASWPDGVAVRVRMGVHTGEPTRHEGGYVGLDLNRAARIAACAHGGQVVASSVTGDLVRSRLPEGAAGERRGVGRCPALRSAGGASPPGLPRHLGQRRRHRHDFADDWTACHWP